MQGTLLLYWNASAAICVWLPVLIWIFHGSDGPGQQKGACVWFGYVWTLCLFLAIILYGNFVLRKYQGTQVPAWYWPFEGSDDSHAAKHLGRLTGAVFLFSHMVLVLLFVLGGSLVEWDLVPLTFFLWILFGAAFSVPLFLRQENPGELGLSQEAPPTDNKNWSPPPQRSQQENATSSSSSLFF